jgi:hypothetical protein
MEEREGSSNIARGMYQEGNRHKTGDSLRIEVMLALRKVLI